MYNVIGDPSEIGRAEEQFKQSFKNLLHKKVKAFVAHRGETSEATVNWSRKVGLGAVFKEADKNRFWNAFGLEQPQKNPNYTPLVEINFLFKRTSRRVAGVAGGLSSSITSCGSGV